MLDQSAEFGVTVLPHRHVVVFQISLAGVVLDIQALFVSPAFHAYRRILREP
jgi:hypothetical protein